MDEKELEHFTNHISKEYLNLIEEDGKDIEYNFTRRVKYVKNSDPETVRVTLTCDIPVHPHSDRLIRYYDTVLPDEILGFEKKYVFSDAYDIVAVYKKRPDEK